MEEPGIKAVGFVCDFPRVLPWPGHNLLRQKETGDITLPAGYSSCQRPEPEDETHMEDGEEWYQ
jgi:hypothetical protein